MYARNAPLSGQRNFLEHSGAGGGFESRLAESGIGMGRLVSDVISPSGRLVGLRVSLAERRHAVASFRWRGGLEGGRRAR